MDELTLDAEFKKLNLGYSTKQEEPVQIDETHTSTNLRQFMYNNETLSSESINAFSLAKRHLNDRNNKTRENIIGAIINNNVPEDYYLISKWARMKLNVVAYLKLLTDNTPYLRVECINKAGRGNNYDLLIRIFYDANTIQEFMVELKFNAASLDEAPQFVSPMKPSQYMNNSYENYYYDNYLPQLSIVSDLKMPSKEEYLKQIHSNAPDCMKQYQDLYYRGCSISSKFTNKEEDIKFYNLAKKLSNESITSFINNTELNSDLLSRYLITTQKNKIYMLYSDEKFILQKINIDDYTIDRVIKNANKFRFECTSKTGKKINILLRWKNGNGIAFPAFQIS